MTRKRRLAQIWLVLALVGGVWGAGLGQAPAARAATAADPAAAAAVTLTAALTITGVTLQNGSASFGSTGGAISNLGWLSLADSVLADNRARIVGGLSNVGQATLNNVTLEANQAVSSTAGALLNDGVMTI